MGDALRGKGVREPDELDTIDAVGATESAPPQVSLGKPGPASDLGELLPVERRHYAIQGEIAKGGMGRVLAARDLRLGRAVAIKELLPKNRDAVRRFEREARITARLQHPSIIHVYEAGVWTGGEPFYAMPKVSGRSLDKVVAERATLAERLGLLPNVIAVADALAYAHNERVIHRDLKPSNVLVGAFGETVVIDWGLAKDLGVPIDPMESLQLRQTHVAAGDTNAGSVVGTPAYMPPEQAHGKSVDQRADVYALGALLYHVLVGEPPYTGTSSADVLEQVKRGPCAPVRRRAPGAPADLVAIVDKAMARDPDARYADAGELAQDLKRFETGQLVAAHDYSATALFGRWLRRFRVPVAIAAIAIIALAIGGIVSVRKIVAEQHKDQRRRLTLLEERGRSELLDGHAGPAAAYLIEAVHDGVTGGARGFLVAEALRPFDARLASLRASATTGKVVIAYSPDGARFAAAGGDDVQLWRDNGTLERTLAAPRGRTRVVAFDPGGTRLLAAGDDRIVRVWRLSDGALLRTLGGHTDTIVDATFSADGTRVATASADGTTRLWIGDAPSDVRRCEDSDTALQPMVTVRFSADGHRLAFGNENATACIWNLDDNVVTYLHGHTGAINSVRWRGDGKYLVTASADGTARVWDAQIRKLPEAGGNYIAGKLVVKPLRHDDRSRVASAEFSSDGSLVLTAGSDRTARIFELPDDIPDDAPATPVREIMKLPATGELVAATFSADDERVATASADGRSTVWQVTKKRVIASFEHADSVDAIALDPDQQHMLTGSRDGWVRIWDIQRGDVVRASFDQESAVNALAVARAGVVAAVGNSRVTLSDGKHARQLPQTGRVFAAAGSPDGTRIAIGGEAEDVFVFDVSLDPAQAGEPRFTLPGHQIVHGIAFSPDGTTIATADQAGALRLWSAATGRLVRTLKHTAPLAAIAYTPDASALVVLDGAGKVLTAPSRGDGPLVARQLTTSGARALAFRSDGKAVVVSGPTDTRIYPLARGVIGERELLVLSGPLGDVQAVAFTTDGTRVITAGGDGAVKVWDAAKGKLLARREAEGSAIHAIAVAADGNVVWAADDDGMVRAWDIHVEERDATALDALAREKLPWALDSSDVVRERGDRNGQR
jgi:eukaryotic-like serine/threonine-protein kinase